jgi:predicted DNA-binding transcriptional regulator YafY
MKELKTTISKKIQRQITIINFLKEGSKTSKELLWHLNYKGHSNSTSTLSNDIKSLKESGFKIDDSIKGYYLLMLDGCSELYSHFIKYQSMAIAYQKALQMPKKYMQYILFEHNALEFNLDVFNDMFKAIQNKREVVFKHVHFQKNNRIKEYVFEPYILKEYQNRWYVVGKTKNGYRTFSLDRISNLRITDKIITINLDGIDEELRYVVGVSFNEETIKPEIIKLQIDNSQKEYIKTTPIFRGQEIIEETSTYFILKLFVGNTVELRQQILKYGGRVKVLEPASLSGQIISEIKEMTNLYAS